ncbi:hypothetical protein DXA94_03830 [Agathobaculum butyriciproducens]|nr:hypothetical protein DXA94_03830 [Agathobaculum butyriciproducens]
MYSVRRKIGDIIAVWGDSNGQGNVSATAAMVASRLAMEGEINKKVLMLSTDKGPYDGVTILNPVVQDNYSMDNLILLAAAGGLKEEEVFLAYTIKVGKNLDVMHSTNDFKRLSSDAVRAYRKILDFASMIYDYIVVDVSGKISSMSEMILSVADIVLLCVSQNMKHLTLLKESSILTNYPPLKEKNVAVVLPVIQNCRIWMLSKSVNILAVQICLFYQRIWRFIVLYQSVVWIILFQDFMTPVAS